MTTEGPRAPARTEALPAWVAIVAAAAIVAPLLAPTGSPGLINPDEGRFAEIAREMVATGDWLVPRLNGVPHWSKPPLSYWAIAASFELFGLNERAARLASSLAATGALLATWFLASRMGGKAAAAASVLVLASLFLFLLLGRIVSTDMIQACFVAWAAALLWHGRADKPRSGSETAAPRRGIPCATYLAFASLGLAFVDKGPVGLGVTLSALGFFLLLRPATRLVSPKQLAIGLAITLAIGLPWFLVVVRLHPDLPGFFLGRELRDRYLTEVHGRAQEPWFFPLVLTLGTLPWTPAVFAELGRIVASLWRRAAAPWRDADADKFLLAWIAGPFILFSFSGSKLPTYLLPLMPPCAIVAARHIVAAASAATGPRRPPILWVVAATAGLLAIGVAVVAIVAYGAPAGGGVLAGAAALASAFLIFGFRGGRVSPLAVVALIAAITLGWAWSVPVIVDEADLKLRSHASHSWVRDVVVGENVRGTPIGSALRPDPGERFADTSANIAIYRLRVNSLPFYLLGTRAEYVPAFGYPAGWEMESDDARAGVATLDHLVERLRRDDRVHVLTRRDSVGEIEKAFGRSLVLIEAYGTGEHAVVLAANR